MPRPKRQLRHLAKARKERKIEKETSVSPLAPPPRSPSASSSSPSTRSSSPTRQSASVEPQPSTSTAPDPAPASISASRRKLEVSKKDDREATKQLWLLVHVGQLTQLPKFAVCSECGNEGFVFEVCKKGNMGFSSRLSMKCKTCKKEHSVMSSPRDHPEDATYEINRRMLLFGHSAGGGHAILKKFGTAIGMPVVSLSSFQKIDRRISAAEIQSGEEALDRAAAAIRSAYAATDPDVAAALDQGQTPVLDIAVSFDGTWMKRGFSSLYGVGVCIEILTGLVIDYHLLSKYCHACKVNQSRLSPAEFRAWKAEHAADCCQNHTGSSKAMEMVAARVMWQRSLSKHNFRYVKMLGDGDSAAEKAVRDSKPYHDKEIEKLECINHVHKRMGTALRKLARQEGLGGRGPGTLTDGKAKSLQNYYHGAVRENTASVGQMKDAIWATFYHSISNDAEHFHDRCPESANSFCWYQRALAQGKQPPSHSGHTSHTYLNPHVAEKVAEVYRRMTNDSLLSRMLHGGTQNPNESLNAQIWGRCPKTIFMGMKRVQAAVAGAVGDFNDGAMHVTAVMDKLWLNTSSITLAHLAAADADRLRQAEAAASASAKAKRKSSSAQRGQQRRTDESLEGEVYGAGMAE